VATKVKQKHGGAINRFQKGESGNPAGPPPRLLSTITAELKAKGYERATANQVADAFETLMNVPQNELADMVKDEKAPMSLRIVGKAMLTAKGWEVLQAMLDRAHGKAKQAIDHTTGGDKLHITREVITGA
jgi:hypothetical protein